MKDSKDECECFKEFFSQRKDASKKELLARSSHDEIKTTKASFTVDLLVTWKLLTCGGATNEKLCQYHRCSISHDELA